MKASPKNKKITMGTFDLIKGTLMMSLIIVHMMPYYDLRQFAWLYHFPWLVEMYSFGAVPAFYLISGYGFKERSVKDALQKTFREMIVPYVVVMLCVAVLFPIVHFLNYRWWPGAVEEAIKIVLTFLIGVRQSGKVLFGYTLYNCGPVWFLFALFIAQNILNLILKIKNMSIQALTVVLVYFLGFNLNRLDYNYFSLHHGLMMVLGIYLGYICKKYKLLNKLYHCKPLYPVLLVNLMLRVFITINPTESWKINLFFNFSELLAAVTLVLFGIWANRFEGKLSDVFRSIGIYTYWIMCIHCVELLVIPWYRWGAVMTEHPFLAFIIDSCIKTVIILSSCKILKKISRYQYKRRLKKHA